MRGPWWLAMVLLMLPHSVWADEPLVEQVRDAITRSVGYLAQAQQPDGSFLVLRCSDAALSKCGLDRSPASEMVVSSPATAVVLAGLWRVTDPRADGVNVKARNFLHEQMDQDGFFGNYRLRSPADGPMCPGEFRQLDLTALNRSVLEGFGELLPPIADQLSSYQTARGVFYPFAVPPSEVTAITSGGAAQKQFARQHGPLMRHYGPLMLELLGEVDPMVNADVFQYLVLHRLMPSALCQYLVRVATEEWDGGFSYFVDSPYAFTATFSQAYQHGAICLEPVKQRLQERLLRDQHEDGSWGTVVETAWAATSLINLGYEGPTLERAIQALLRQQQPDGSWERALWRKLRGHPFWFGSKEVSTGIVLETLDRFQTPKNSGRHSNAGGEATGAEANRTGVVRLLAAWSAEGASRACARSSKRPQIPSIDARPHRISTTVRFHQRPG